MRKRTVSLLFGCALLCAPLGACGGARVVPVPPPVRQPRVSVPATPPAPRPVPQPQVLQLPGLEGVIGANAAALVGQFGVPRIDLAEGDARKLQFASGACVLDIFLYPPAGGGEPRATHVAARRASDGSEVDRAACIAALSQR
jgi:hypothetical protein